MIAQAIRKSLRGQAKQALVSASSTISTDEIIKRLERVFGNASSEASILREFIQQVRSKVNLLLHGA